MRAFDHLAIKHKLTLMMTLASAVTLVLASVILLSQEAARARGYAVSDLRSMAAIIATNSIGAAEFEDQKAAGENLAGLGCQGHRCLHAPHGWWPFRPVSASLHLGFAVVTQRLLRRSSAGPAVERLTPARPSEAPPAIGT